MELQRCGINKFEPKENLQIQGYYDKDFNCHLIHEKDCH